MDNIKMTHLFIPFGEDGNKENAIEVYLTGVIYNKGEHSYYKNYKIIEVCDKNNFTHEAFEDELFEIEEKIQKEVK